jgi:hypothetical protein
VVWNTHLYRTEISGEQEKEVDNHHFLWFCLVMAGLKTFLQRVAPSLGLTGGALYERQRALVALGALKTLPGRGPGSGVPFTAENFAAVLISVLAADALTEVDQRVVALCDAIPWRSGSASAAQGELYQRKGGPTFKTEVGRVLTGQPLAWPWMTGRMRYRYALGIRVSRLWRGEIVVSVGPGPGGSRTLQFRPLTGDERSKLINHTVEIELPAIMFLQKFTIAALSQPETDEEDET